MQKLSIEQLNELLTNGKTWFVISPDGKKPPRKITKVRLLSDSLSIFHATKHPKLSGMIHVYGVGTAITQEELENDDIQTKVVVACSSAQDKALQAEYLNQEFQKLGPSRIQSLVGYQGNGKPIIETGPELPIPIVTPDSIEDIQAIFVCLNKAEQTQAKASGLAPTSPKTPPLGVFFVSSKL